MKSLNDDERFLLACVCAISIFLVSAPLSAELYTYVDSEGVVHFTNIASELPAKHVAKEPKKLKNTYRWKDKKGKKRTVHRLDVTKYDSIIADAAKYYSLPPALIKAVVAAESHFEAKAVSSAGAQGLMQLMPATAREMKVNDSFDPIDNIYGGTRYLRILSNRFDGNLKKTVAAYNAGPGAVLKRNAVPRYPETIKYLERVLKYYKYYREQQSH